MPGEVIQDSLIKNKAATKCLWEQRMRADMENRKLAEVKENQKLVRKTSIKWKFQQSQSLDLNEQPPTTHITISSTRNNEIPHNLLQTHPLSPGSLFAAQESALSRKILKMEKSQEALKIEFEKLMQKNQEICLKLKTSVEENALLKIKLKEFQENQNQLKGHPDAASFIAVKTEKPDPPIAMKSKTFVERKSLKRDFPKPDCQNPSEPTTDEAGPSKKVKINRSNSVKEKISIFEQVKKNNGVDRSSSFVVGSVRGRFPLKMMQNSNSPLQEL